MSNIDPENYRELQKWVSDKDIEGVNGNSSKEELQEAYEEYDTGSSEPSENSSEVEETSSENEPDMQKKPSKDAPDGETMFDQEEVELDSIDQQKDGEMDSEEAGILSDTPTEDGETLPETQTPDSVSGVSELSKQEVKELHRNVNQGMVFGLGTLFNIPVKKFTEERLDKIAETSKEAVNKIMPDSWKDTAGTGASFSSAVMPHIQAVMDGQMERMKDAQESEEQEETEEDEEVETIGEDEVIEEL